MGRAREIERELLDPIARRGAQLTRQRIEDARANAEVLREPEGPAETRQGASDRLAVADDFCSALTGE
jgi:hypothetical protein